MQIKGLLTRGMKSAKKNPDRDTNTYTQRLIWLVSKNWSYIIQEFFSSVFL